MLNQILAITAMNVRSIPERWGPSLVIVIGLAGVAPPCVQALLDAWMGTAPQPLHLATMAAITVVAGVAAAKLFRWE